MARFFAIILLSLAGFLQPALGHDGPPDLKLTYEVSLAARRQHLYHVTMRLEGVASPNLTVSLPAWNALYQIRDFSQYLRRFRAQDPAGHTLPFELLDKQTWRIGLNGRTRVEIAYDILANTPGSFNSELNDEHAFFNGAQIFLYWVDHLDVPATLRIQDIPPGWRVATALPRTAEADAVFSAGDYDQLVDSPVEIGAFEARHFQARAANFHVIIHGPKESYKADDWLAIIKKIVLYEMELMNDVPFTDYTFIYHIGPRAGGGMEHRNSTAIGLSESALQDHPDGLAGVTAHEFFHLWNVKRIRPRVFDRIDYAREVYTKALWFSEGGTSYVAALTLLRTGLKAREQFYADLAREIETLQNRPGRLVQSAEDASWFTWYDKYPAFRSPDGSISYYNKGLILGFLLDLKIRSATGGQRSFDDILRFMNEWFAKARVGFAEHEILRTLNALTGTDFSDFYRQYISGTAELPYDELLGLAGLTLESKEFSAPEAGFSAKRPFGQFDRALQVTRVRSGSAAEKAGLQVGDELVEYAGLSFGAQEEDETPRWTGPEPARLKVRRQGRALDITFTPDTLRRLQYIIREIPSPTPAQLKVRNGLLTGK